MAAVLSAVISLASGLAVLPTSVQDVHAQAQSCVTNEETVIDGEGSTRSESAIIEIEQRTTETCSSDTSVTAQSDEDGRTTSNEEEEYDYDYDYEHEYEYYE